MACALWKNGCASFGALAAIFRRQPKVAFGLGDVNIGIGKDPLSVLRREAADVIEWRCVTKTRSTSSGV